MHRRQQSYWNLGGSVLLCFFLACSFIMRFAVPDSLPTAGSRLRLVLDNLSLSLGNGTVALTALFLAALLLSRHLRRIGWRGNLLFHIVCAGLAAVWLTGQSFQIDNTLDSLTKAPGQICKSLIYFLGSFYFLELSGGALLSFLDGGRDLPEDSRLGRFFREHGFAACFAFLLICCLPLWIICFPGYMDPDSYCELAYGFGIYEFYGQLPPVHALYLTAFVKLGRLLGSANLGLYLIVCLQMLVFAAVMSYLLLSLRSFGAPTWLRLLAFVTVVVSPEYIVVAASVGKDTIYSYGALLFLIETAWLLRLGESYWKSRRHLVLLIISIVVTMLMRMNGKYLVILCAIAYLLFVRKTCSRAAFRRALLVFLCPIVFSFAFHAAVMAHYDIIPGSKREALAIPFQQTARTVFEHGGELPEEEIEAIDAVLSFEDIGKEYYPYDSSPVKQYFQDDADSAALLRYFRVWLKEGLRYPLSYLKATLNQNYPLVSPWIRNSITPGHTDSSRHTHISEPIGIHDVDVADGLEDCLRGIDKLISALPVPSLYTRIGGCTVLILLLCCGAVVRKPRFLLYALPALVNMAMIFACPAVQQRLNYPILYALPLLVTAYIVLPEKESKEAAEMPEEEKRRGPGAARPALLTALLALALALTFALLSVKGSEERPAEDVRWQFAPGQILCIGDSLTAGSCFGSDLQGSSIEQSYPYYLGRMLSTRADSLALPGASASDWYKAFSEELDCGAYDTFILWLGTNHAPADTLAADVLGRADPGDYAETETGYYCRLIEKIRSEKPDALIVLLNVFASKDDVEEANRGIAAIAEHYGLPLIDMSDLGADAHPELHAGLQNPHFGKTGNLYVASRIVDGLKSYFTEDPSRCEYGLTTAEARP